MARSLSARLVSLAALAAVCAALPAAEARFAQPARDGITVISAAGRARIATVEHDGRALLALDDLAARFRLTLDEDPRAGTLSVGAGGTVIILTADQQLISVGGRFVSLRAAPRRVRGRWLVPFDFLDRALGAAWPGQIEFRAGSRLLIVGDLQVPTVAAGYRAGPGRGQLRLEVTPGVPHAVSQRADRLVVTFEADAVDLVRRPRLGGGLATGFGPLDGGPGFALDLGPDFDSYRVSSEPAAGGGTTLVIALRAAPAAADAAPAPAPSPRPDPPAADPLPDFAAGPAVRVVAIDPGHGGADSGSAGPAGALEKDITLAIARRLQTVLEDRLGLGVVLTRARDETVGLDARAAIANNNKADLFISLHANASPRPAAAGAEVFYLSIDEYAAEARELALRDVEPVPVVGGGRRRIDPVPWNTAQILYVDRSARLADIVEAELRQRVVTSTGPARQAPFRVLVGANMPAVLVELGSLADPENETRLASVPFRDAVADALLASIQRFGDELERGGPVADLAPGA